MKLHQLFWMALVALALIGVSYLVIRPVSAPLAAGAASLGPGDPAARAASAGDLIAFWRARTENNKSDFISLTYLGQAYLRRARETGDVSALVSAEAAFHQALVLDPKYENAQAYLAAALFARHDFQGALAQANHVFGYDPHALLLLGTIGDAQLELGNYAEAEKAYQSLLDRAPGPAVYARRARLAWLKGQPQEATDWMQRAAFESAAEEDTGEEQAWYEFQLGELYFNRGRLDDAAQHYTSALKLFDNYYLALAGMGKVRAGQGRLEEAIAYYEHAVAIIPQPDFLAALGDLYAAAGRADKAPQQYDTVEFIGKLAAINQAVYNRQLALFYANHDRSVGQALDFASKELRARKDIYGYDALAWTLYKNGRYAEAADAMQQALQLGTQDAQLQYHAGMIYAARGDSARAVEWLNRAMATNPHFDFLQARLAQAKLEALK